MRRLFIRAWTASALALAFAAEGGVTFDFRAASERMFGGTGGENLVKREASAWTPSRCVHVAIQPYAGAAFRERIKPYVDITYADGMGELRIRDSIAEILTENPVVARSVAAHLTQEIVLPDREGGVYRLAMQFQKRIDGGGLMAGAVLTPYDSTKRGAAACDKPQFLRLGGADTEWFPFAADIVVKKGYDRLRFNLRTYSPGFFRFKDIQLFKKADEPPVTVTLGAHGLADPSFALGSGQCGFVSWWWKRRYDEAKLDPAAVEVELAFPPFVECHDLSFAVSNTVRRARDADGALRLTFRPSVLPETSYNKTYPLGAIIGSSAAPGTEGWGTFRVIRDGKDLVPPLRTRYFVVPPVKGVAPARYCNGFICGYTKFPKESSVRQIAETAVAAGARWVMPHSQPFEHVWREAGFTVVTPALWAPANGFRIPGKWKTNELFVASGAIPQPEMAPCPIAVYEEGETFRTDTVPYLMKRLAGMDGIWSNWEPYPYFGKGCFCARCRARFAAFVGVSDDEMAKGWPAETRYGGKWFPSIQKFRAREHGRLVKTLDKYISLATGGDKSHGFIPGISWGEIGSTWRARDVAPEVRAIEYAGSLKWLDPWGPYPRWNPTVPYSLPEDALVEYYFAAKDAREQINRDYPLPHRPKLLAFPQGYQMGDIVQPEWIALALDAYFFNGWEASTLFFFPCGYDARYWKAFAQATTRAASCEDYVQKGKRVDGDVQIAVDPACERKAASVGFYLPHIRDVSLLQHAAYRLDGRLMVAVMNFRERVDATFTLKVPGADRPAAILRDGKPFRGQTDARTLAGGVRLSAPAAGTTVYEFVP